MVFITRYLNVETVEGIVINNTCALYIIFFMSLSFILLYLLILSSTIFIGLLILLTLFIIQIIMLYIIGQQLFALFLLGVYVGAILVFFIFVVMSFIFFGKSYIITRNLWGFFILLALIYIYIYYIYGYSNSVGSSDSLFFYNFIYNIDTYTFDELSVIGILLFDIDMMYIVVAVSLLLFVALLGSITFNASSLVKYSSSFYIPDKVHI